SIVMKNLKKIVCSVFVLGITLLGFMAKAERITDEVSLRQSIEASLVSSGEVRASRGEPEKNKAILGLCDRRIEILTRIRDKRAVKPGDVMRIIGNYLGECKIKSELETEQLRKSGTPADLKYNVEVLIRIYGDIRGKYSDAVSSAKTPEPTHVSKQFLHKREGRKGRFYKGGR
ncbi:MAG: hypothetical protein IKE05_04325, partial [Clostridia bacterium]|nr:hypothetical protein [Clostridia bacterium]